MRNEELQTELLLTPLNDGLRLAMIRTGDPDPPSSLRGSIVS